MQIDRENGTIRLPDGFSISPDLTQDAFRALPVFQAARSTDCGTLPFIHYHLSGGQIEGHELLVGLCFYDQLLIHAQITASFYPPGPNDWSNYSLDVEAATKRYHDALLQRMFGKPSTGESFLFRRLPKGQETLDRPLDWKFPWGSVFSCHDSRGGGTFIRVSYGNRNEEASKAYSQRSKAR